jgi:hypothetical protein
MGHSKRCTLYNQIDTGGKFATGVVDNGGKFATGINDTVYKESFQIAWLLLQAHLILNTTRRVLFTKDGIVTYTVHFIPVQESVLVCTPVLANAFKVCNKYFKDAYTKAS